MTLGDFITRASFRGLQLRTTNIGNHYYLIDSSGLRVRLPVLSVYSELPEEFQGYLCDIFGLERIDFELDDPERHN